MSKRGENEVEREGERAIRGEGGEREKERCILMYFTHFCPITSYICFCIVILILNIKPLTDLLVLRLNTGVFTVARLVCVFITPPKLFCAVSRTRVERKSSWSLDILSGIGGPCRNRCVITPACDQLS